MNTKNKISQAITAGLLAGYGGQTKFKKVNRGSFELKSSHYENDGFIYHDEWTNGGGQEIVKVGENRFTRVYAGGTIDNSPEIISQLIHFIQTLKDKTRLFTDCDLVEGDWQYQYKVLDTEPKFNLIVGKETIKHHGKMVFVHCFVLSPIKA